MAGSGRGIGGRVLFEVPREVAFDFLVDPHNRAQWQSSLRRVSAIDGAVGVGQTWVDETKPGLHARMRTTMLDRPSRWSETGTWRRVRAELTLRFTEEAAGCLVDYRFRIRALGPLGLAATLAAAPAVGADLRRAAHLLRPDSSAV